MKTRLQKLRDEIIFSVWEEYKDELTMKEIGEIFGLSLPQVWRVIQDQGKQKRSAIVTS